MITSSNTLSPGYDVSFRYVEEAGRGSSSPSDVAEQWAAVSADGVISKEELEQYPELLIHIEDTLGYGSIEVFLYAHGSSGSVDLFGGVTLTPESIDAINASVSGSVNGGDQYAESETNQLPTTVDPTSTYVVFILSNGETVTFDGPGAGALANEFANVYNNSPTFRQTIVTLAGEQDGQYSFHSLPLPADASSQVLGFNVAGTDGNDESSGVFIQSNPSFEFNVAATIIHEVAHDLHPDDHDDHGHEEEGLPDTGESHSREQSLFHATIVNELETNGVSVDYDVDGDDYSHNILIFDKAFTSSSDQSGGAVSSNDIVTDELGNEVNAFDYYSGLYEEAKTHIANGDYESAKAVMDQIPPDAQITLDFENPQTGELTTVTYNVRELFLQDLMLASDSAHRFNTGEDNTQSKEDLAGFLNHLTQNDPSGSWVDTVASASIGIHFDLAEELPGYEPSGGSGVKDFEGFNRDALDRALKLMRINGLLEELAPMEFPRE